MLNKKIDIFQKINSFKGKLTGTYLHIDELKVFLDSLSSLLGDINDEVTTSLNTDVPKIVGTQVATEIDKLKASIRVPEDGTDYVLTEEDKSEIAKKITPPKTKKEVVVVKEITTPVVTEKAMYEDAETIANKLNTKKEIIDISVIKGLFKTIEELKRAIRNKEKGSGGGGGLGAVQHETKNVSSATTTITTDYKIAGNGYAIMGAYYQSTLIMRGEHYTVGGDRKTLSLNFVPQDSTKIDLIYVRG